MAEELRVPKMGENVDTIQVISVLVKAGDIIEEGQAVVEVETDKATVEIPSEVAGKVAKVHVAEGDEIEEDALLLTFEGEGKGEAGEEKEESAAEKEDEAAGEEAGEEQEQEQAKQEKQEKEPKEKEREQEQKQGKKEKDKEEEEQAEEEQAEEEQAEEEEEQEKDEEKEAGGKEKPEDAKAGEGKPPKEEQAEEEEPAEAAEETARQDDRLITPESITLAEGARVPASPSVRRFAREIGIDINQVPGSGDQGRVSQEDVKAYARQVNAGRAEATAAGQPEELPDFSQWGEIDRQKISTIRKVTAKRTAQSWTTIPHVTIHDQADITELEALRKKFADRAEKVDGKLTMAVMVCKVAAHALKHFPQFNASIDLAAKEIVYKRYINLGIAVNTDRGLMVPVVRDADRKNMVDLSVEILQLAQKVRTGKISREEMEGGTFTVTNLGRIGGGHFTPIINYPEVAILGMGRARKAPAFVNGEVRERVMLPLSLAFDHRIIDGADGAKFLQWIVDAIHDPIMLSLEG